MRNLAPVFATVFLLGTVNVAMAQDSSSGSMDMEKPMSKNSQLQGNDSKMQKQDQMTGDARGSTTGKKLIKSKAQRQDATNGGLDGAK